MQKIMDWRIANSLEKLRAQLNERFPTRNKVSDGGYGDARHQASKASDHNAWVRDSKGQPIVTARDFTNDEATMSGQWLANALIASRDPRIKYVIWNKQICSSKQQPWVWRPYSGANAHQHHVHVSVMPSQTLFDDVSDWKLGEVQGEAETPLKTAQSKPAPSLNLQKGDKGEGVKKLQTALHYNGLLSMAEVDGIFGPATEKAVKAYQVKKNLRPDGKVGPSTGAALNLV